MNYIEAPTEFPATGPSLFLAGGISDAENWQQQLLQLLPQGDYTVLNPRRTLFSGDDPAAAVEQIEWEFRHIRRASVVAFWFPPQTLCPIALFELGACSAAGAAIVVGTDANYARRDDVEVQLRLRRPEVAIAHCLLELAEQVAGRPELKGTLG